jgi:hypothetical protein
MNLQKEADQAFMSFLQHLRVELEEVGASQDDIMKIAEAFSYAIGNGIHRVDEAVVRGLRRRERGYAFEYFALSAIAQEHSGRIGHETLTEILRGMAEDIVERLRPAQSRLGLDWLVPITLET